MRLPALLLLIGIIAGCSAATYAESDPPVPQAAPSAVTRSATPPALPASLPTARPLTFTVEYGDAPAVQAHPGVTVRESTVTLPAYPLEPYQSEQIDPFYMWPYKRFDIDRFRTEAPSPAPRTFRTLVLENEFLAVTILPEVGGRILQVVHKPSGTHMFYENSVLKPTAWGPAQQGGWPALGGLEWGLPVEEHGYAWGDAWGYIPLDYGDDRAAVTVFTPQDGRALNASVTVELAAGAAAFTIEPMVTNVSEHLVSFDYWHNAMLAPGDGQGISRDVHIVLPTDAMRVHSTEDTRLPTAEVTDPISWPIYQGRDLSRLRTWREYAGLFEYPAAHGPFAAVYDTIQDAGAVRAYPAEIVRGSKIFALGGSRPLDPALYTDDGRAYIELHAGLAPDFAQQVNLAAGESVTWRETWYPVHGLGDLSVANDLVALRLQIDAQRVQASIYAVRPLEAAVVLEGASGELSRAPVTLEPGVPTTVIWEGADVGSSVRSLRIETVHGPVIEYQSVAE